MPRPYLCLTICPNSSILYSAQNSLPKEALHILTQTRVTLVIAVIAITLIIVGSLSMIPAQEIVLEQAPTAQTHPQPVDTGHEALEIPPERLRDEEVTTFKPRLEMAPIIENRRTSQAFLPLLEQAVPAPAAATVTPQLFPEPLLPPPDGVHREANVPILMYHYISEPPPGADAIRRGLSVTPAQFEEHLRYLKENGYRTISLYQLLLHLTHGEPLPEKPIILTFDDGYRDNFENAFPLLQEYGFKATFFLITNFIDEGRPLYMTWDQVKTLIQAGHEIGGHSRDHPDLRGKDIDFLVWQILGTKEAIQNGAGITPRFFSYPSGKYDENTIAVLKSAHYWGAVTVHQGVRQSSDALFELQRIRIHSHYGADELDWVLKYYLGE
jgi:peptidoglycan/xylan/chitin deacetylase (PgdA/CDA1 family)